MLRISLALLSVSLAVIVVLGQTDYCAKGLCSGTTTHIACNNKGAWATTCPTSPKPYLINMNQTVWQNMVRLHNVRRNNMALGKVANYDTARRMATMIWSPELAKLAEFNARQCQMKHDACHNTNKFKSSGQNLAWSAYSGASSSQTDEQLITSSVNRWWNENKNANMAVINSYPSAWTGGVIGHFTAMAQQSSYALGCAASRYFADNLNNFLLVCNYATTNIIGRAVYVRGPTAAGCNTGKNPNFPGLCKASEVYTV